MVGRQTVATRESVSSTARPGHGARPARNLRDALWTATGVRSILYNLQFAAMVAIVVIVAVNAA